jgi:hypothetical protein
MRGYLMAMLIGIAKTLNVSLVIDAGPVISVDEEGGVSTTARELVGDVSIVDPWAIIPGVSKSMVALAYDLSKAALLLFKRGCKGCSSSQEEGEGSSE